jgi:hypothetical protein
MQILRKIQQNLTKTFATHSTGTEPIKVETNLQKKQILDFL